jgi:hypothetical protein
VRVGMLAGVAEFVERGLPRAGFRLALALGVAGMLGTACAGVVVPAGTLEELRAYRDEAVSAERVLEAVAISQAIVDRELALLAAADPSASPESVAASWMELGRAQAVAYDRESARVSHQHALDAVA